MTLILEKGASLNLSKTHGSLRNIIVGLGWDIRDSDQEVFDLDASILMVGPNGMAKNESDLVFYNNLKTPCGAVTHTGDNKTGDGEGDDETIDVALDKVPAGIDKLMIFVSIHNAEKLKQNFGQVLNAFIRLVNKDTQEEVTRYDLSEAEETATYTSIIFGEIYRYHGDWKFKAVGRGVKGGLAEFARMHGLNA